MQRTMFKARIAYHQSQNLTFLYSLKHRVYNTMSYKRVTNLGWVSHRTLASMVGKKKKDPRSVFFFRAPPCLPFLFFPSKYIPHNRACAKWWCSSTSRRWRWPCSARQTQESNSEEDYGTLQWTEEKTSQLIKSLHIHNNSMIMTCLFSLSLLTLSTRKQIQPLSMVI